MKVLLATDQSRHSRAAAKFLQNITLPVDSKLFVLYVNTVGQSPKLRKPGKRDQVAKSMSNLADEVRKKALQHLNSLEKSFQNSKLNIHSFILDGIPGEQVLKAIKMHKIDLAVLGSRGHSKISRLLLGSVSEWIVNEASCSVLIGRPLSHKPKSSGGLNILVATDGSADAQAAVQFLTNLKFPPSSTVTLLHVVKKHVVETGALFTTNRMSEAEFCDVVEKSLKAKGRKGTALLRDTQKQFKGSGLKIVEELAFGNEADEILKAVKRVRADLVVVGSRGVTGLRRILLGSVSHNIALHAQCSVLIARSPRS